MTNVQYPFTFIVNKLFTNAPTLSAITWTSSFAWVTIFQKSQVNLELTISKLTKYIMHWGVQKLYMLYIRSVVQASLGHQQCFTDQQRWLTTTPESASPWGKPISGPPDGHRSLPPHDR
jgi:hypothetical protein